MTVEEIKEKLRHGMTSEEAIAELDKMIVADPRNEEALIERGMLHWGCGHRAQAMNDYYAAIEINPESRARQALQSVMSILDYYNKDLYNP